MSGIIYFIKSKKEANEDIRILWLNYNDYWKEIFSNAN